MISVETLLQYLVEDKKALAHTVLQEAVGQLEVVFIIEHIKVLYYTIIRHMSVGKAHHLVEDRQGIAHTTVGKTGFITALYIVIVPLLNLLLRRRIPTNGIFAIVFAVLGFYIMCINGDSGLTYADAMLLLCAIMFSLQIMFIDVYVDECDPIKLTFVQFVVASLLSLPAMAIEGFPPASAVGQNIIPVLYVGIMSAGVGFTFQSIGQKFAPPELATLIMSLESVIAFIGGVAFLHESYSAKEFAGCIIVLLSVFLAQLSVPHTMLKANHSKFFID